MTREGEGLQYGLDTFRSLEWQVLKQRSPPALVLDLQQTNGVFCLSKASDIPPSSPVTPSVPHLGSVLCTKG